MGSNRKRMKVQICAVFSLVHTSFAAHQPIYQQQQQAEGYNVEAYQQQYQSNPYQYQAEVDLDQYHQLNQYQQPQQYDRYDTVDPYNQQQQYAEYNPALFYKPKKSTHKKYQKEVEEEHYEPQPFAYEYGGSDSSGRHFAKTEAKDDEGIVRGEYRVELPDGRVQIVSYTADPVNGYQADVRYEGEARPYVPEEEDELREQRPKYVPQHKPYARRY